MDGRIRLGDGVGIDLASGATVGLDGCVAGADAVAVSHAHADHLVGRASPVVCSPLTAALAAARRDSLAGVTPASHPAIDLVNAGHVAGSRAVLLDDGDRRILYTGDVSVRDRFFLEGFDPPPADVLVLEATYGRPGYEFPPTDAVVRDAIAWLNGTMDVPVLLFGYALGRAQTLELLVERSDRSRLFATPAVQRINDVIAAHRDVAFPARTYTDETTLEPGDALVLPGSAAGVDVADLRESTGALAAGFSGWAVDSSFRYRRGYDEAFVLSDHCDFPELLGIVEAVDPDLVYTHHGFADDLATAVTRDCGIPARALRRNQRTLGEFG